LQSTALAQRSSIPTDKELKIEFPKIDGWEKGEIYRYPQAGLGYSIGYESKNGGFVDIYVYDGGFKAIPNGITSNIVKMQFEQAKGDIFRAEKQGQYKNVKELKSDTITLGGIDGRIKSLYSLFNLTAGNNNLTSEVYLFGYKNNFIKIRASRLRENAGTINKDVATLLAAMDTLFTK
jgi:hypothetical protein